MPETPKNFVNEDDDIANDLDMHSLTIGSFDSSNSTNNSNHKKEHSIDADQVIKEIESIYSGNDSKLMHGTNLYPNGNQKPDPMLSLSASKLLDVALKTWQQANLNSNNLKIYFNDDKYEHSMVDPEHTIDQDLDSEYQFYSLPANLNNELNDLASDFNQSANDSNVASEFQPKPGAAKFNLETKNETEISELSMANEKKSVFNIDSKSDSDQLQTKHEQKEFLDKLNQLSIVQLNELYIELEQIIKIRSEILIDELALRDEYEFEKEQKNTFISLLLSIQNKRKIYSSSAANGGRCSPSGSGQNRKGQRQNTYNRLVRRNTNDGLKSTRKNVNNSGLLNLARDLTTIGSSIKESILPSASKVYPIYLTMVIPYKTSMMPLDLSTLQMLNKCKIEF